MMNLISFLKHDTRKNIQPHWLITGRHEPQILLCSG